MRPVVLLCCCFVAVAVTLVSGASTYIIGPQGVSCADACHAKGLNCNPHIVTNNNTALFTKLGISCDADSEAWWAEDQPSYVSGSSDPNYGKCLGFKGVPGGVQCGAFFPTTRRLCACDDPNSVSSVAAFGTGLSSSFVDTTERVILNWIVPSDSYGVLTHFWATAWHPILNNTKVRYYIDDETVASIQFYPPMACGVGFDDQFTPWGTQWFGKGAAEGSWFNNFRIPFQRSIRVTVQLNSGVGGGFYMIVRGLPVKKDVSFINIGGVAVPPKARMNLFVFNKVVNPLEWVPIVDLPQGRGLFFMHTLSVSSGNLNFLEGCYHAYTPYNQAFPGTVLSTGTEDYFDSGWYFNAGQFRFPVSGFTHLNQSGGHVTWSAYRFHEMDPVPFENGFRFVWRNGDANDPAGQKCYMEYGGTVVGSPTQSEVLAYAWVYTW